MNRANDKGAYRPIKQRVAKLIAWPKVSKLILALAIVSLVLAVTSCGEQVDQDSSDRPAPPEGVQSFKVPERPDHVEKSVSYSQTPPVAGDHWPVWQNCGFYETSIKDERAVHSMEHGAVWVTYRPDLPAGQAEALQDVASDQDYVLVSPYLNLPAPVVVSAWGKQLLLKEADDPRLKQFVESFTEGPQTPEPGAPCTDGEGKP